MEENIIDVIWKKNIKIINNGREVEEYNKNHAILDMVTEIESPCSDMDSFGLDMVKDCLTCSNSDYKIMLDGKVIKDFKKLSSNAEEENKERYVIEFFDDIPASDNIISYLEDNNSNYRITRDSDGIILRPFLEDRKRKEEEQEKMRAEFEKMERRFYAPYRQQPSKEPTPVVKKKSIFNRIFGTRKTQRKYNKIIKDRFKNKMNLSFFCFQKTRF